MHGLECVAKRLLCLALTAGKPARGVEPGADRRYPVDPCREQRHLWLAPGSCDAAAPRPPRRPRPDRASDAPRRPSRTGSSATPHPDDRQPPRLSHRAEQLSTRHPGLLCRPWPLLLPLGRDFTTVAPNQVWLADLTYIPTGEGRLYLAAVLDLHTRKIVGWSIRETLHTRSPPRRSIWPSSGSGRRQA